MWIGFLLADFFLAYLGRSLEHGEVAWEIEFLDHRAAFLASVDEKTFRANEVERISEICFYF